MSKIKQTNITKDIPPKDTPAKATTDDVKEKPIVIKLTPRELRLIEEFRSGTEDVTRVEEIADLKKLQEDQAKARKLKANHVWDHVMVEGTFSNVESPGGTAEFTFYKYLGDPVIKYKLRDGHKHKIPRMVATYLNTYCKYRIHASSTDAAGNPLPNIGEIISRYKFYTQFVATGDPREAGLFPGKEITTVSYG